LPAYFIATTRQYEDNHIPLGIRDGEVVSKYKASDHQYPAVVIRDVDGAEVVMEAIPDETYAALQEGDRVRNSSPAGSEYGVTQVTQVTQVTGAVRSYLDCFPGRCLRVMTFIVRFTTCTDKRRR